MKELTSEEFGKEMQILWQNISVDERNQLADIIKDYYDCGDRAYAIIAYMQQTI